LFVAWSLLVIGWVVISPGVWHNIFVWSSYVCGLLAITASTVIPNPRFNLGDFASLGFVNGGVALIFAGLFWAAIGFPAALVFVILAVAFYCGSSFMAAS
jgi:hypothetical protein